MKFPIGMLVLRAQISNMQFRSTCKILTETYNTQSEKTAHWQVISQLKKTEEMFRLHESKESISKFLFKCFDNQSHTNDLLINACDRFSQRKDLTYIIIMSFEEWLQKNRENYTPTLEKKMEIFQAALKQQNYQLAKLVFKGLNISDQTDCFKVFAETLLQEKKFAEASMCIKLLNLQEKFSLEEVVFPLLLDNQTYFVLLYLRHYPQLQLELAKKLDLLLADYKDLKISNELLRYLSRKKLYQMLTFVATTFKIPTVECKTLHFIRSKGALNTLIKRKKQLSVAKESWEDMVSSVIGDSDVLKQHLIVTLLKYDKKETAMEMAQKYGIPKDQLPTTLMDYEDVTKSEISDENCIEEQLDTVLSEEDLNPSNEKSESEYLKFELSISDIKFVATEESFLNCITELSQNYKIIGIDCEWKPRFGLSQDRLSLLQLAVFDKVFILDMLTLGECLQEQHWDSLMDNVFGNPKIIKLGCGIMIDVQMLVDSNKGTKGKPIKFSHVLDMAIFYQKLQDVYPDKMSSDENSNLKGLSKLCNIFLGKPLNKEDRLCNWEKRPLTDSQLEYAALDAHCLLQIYDKLKEMSIKMEMNFDHLAKVSIVLTTSVWKPKRKSKGIKQDHEFTVHSLVPIANFKVAVDPKFENLGKKLREYGADVNIFPRQSDWREALRFAKFERRIVLCSKDLAKQLKSRISSGLVFELFENEYDDTATIANIFQYFNLELKTSSMFSRCRECNSVNVKRLSLHDLEILYKQSHNEKGKIQECEDQICESVSELQSTVSDMLRTGIDIKFSNFNMDRLKDAEYGLLCTSCGNIHCR